LISSQGAAPPQDGEPLTWKQDIFEDPDVLRITLRPLITLPSVKEHLTPSKFSNLRIALRDYCENLMQEGYLTSCSLPNSDIPLPTPRYVPYVPPILGQV
jgi:hypothetical protein